MKALMCGGMTGIGESTWSRPRPTWTRRSGACGCIMTRRRGCGLTSGRSSWQTWTALITASASGRWTGDIGPDYEFLRRAVENAVFSGVQSLFPYESDDLGGHIANPTAEGYIRWIEYGALSPVYRPHCTHNLERMPWTFGPEAETVAHQYENMRYRLLPVFYAAAHENYETGEPILRRLDLYYPQF